MDDIRVLLVDDHVGLRAELRRLLTGQPDIQLVAEAGGARETVRLALAEALTVVVMDLSLPDGDGITATAEIVQQRPELRVLGLSQHEDPGHLKRLLAVGARGYVLKRNAADGLLTAIRAVAVGGTYIDPSFANKQSEPQPERDDRAVQVIPPAPAATTEALGVDELAVLQRVAWGYSNREIAEQLGMALTDVAAHRAQAMQKLGLRTRIDIVRYAEAQGWKREESDEV